ncbi:TRAP transporter substrate-binding protein [Roseospira visakhapatnamensis]|uniref:Tripartite ATP-independent transporter DctP family solute receptor n=1 Tax=Roseospira visakhapatnamensis TaxID=390880 RepID=A0A7W6RAY6_9PROT|nr:TRAP transporter substrate-binding protein [Roseospira visakhapatnamensis]MBB4264569.1 tripartite ATP-independent transporter DctP family solute receptor [Roseospira visakhapatnamensis]
MSKRQYLGALVGASLLMSGTAVEARTLKLNHNNPESHPVHEAAEYMSKRLEELTNGDLKIRVYANAQLGTQRESMEMIQNGLLDMARSNASELEAFDESYSALNLPYIFKDEAHYYDVLSGDIGADILSSSKDKGFLGIAYYVEGARSFYANTEITSPADLEGMKIRVQPSPSAIRMVELLGGIPTPIAYGELYSALQLGVVDGAENNPLALTSARHGEVAKVYSNDQHTMIPSVVLISTQTWESLSEAEQKALMQAGRDSMDHARALWNKQEAKGVETAKQEMGVRFIEVDKAPFVEAVLPMHEEAAAASPRVADLIQRIKALGE